MAVLDITPDDCSTPEVTTPSGSPTLSPDPNLHPTFIMRNLSPTSVSELFSRASQATLIFEDTYRLVQVDQIRFDSDVNAYLIEPASTNYFNQGYDTQCVYVSHSALYITSNGDYVQTDQGEYITIDPELPVTQTFSLDAGNYTLWVNGSASATVSAGTAVGTGFLTAIESDISPARADEAKADVSQVGGNGACHFAITTAGTVTVTITDAVDGDEVQLESGIWQTSYIPNNTTSTTRAAEHLYAPEV